MTLLQARTTKVAFCVVVFFAGSVSPAQQASTTAVPDLMGQVGGGGTTNYIPIWTNNTTLGNSTIYETGGHVGIGTQKPDGMLTVAGSVYANGVVQAERYDSLRGPILSWPGYVNLFVGSLAGADNAGSYNVFVGDEAGQYNSAGTYNVFLGHQAGRYNGGSYNVFLGQAAGYKNVNGTDNTFVGWESGGNTFGGTDNTYVGYESGANATGSNNIYLGEIYFTLNENNTIRIGTHQQTSAYIGGVYNALSSAGIPVYINSSGQLGTQTSSRRFKEQIRDMGDSSSALMKLRPVTFLYKPEYDKGQRTLQYGLIAEEVANVYPDLVAYDPDGEPYTVKYQYLTTMLLNEMQRQYRRAGDEAEVIKSQEQKISELEQRLSRLEGVVEKSLRIPENQAAYVPKGDLSQPLQPLQQ